MQKLSRYANGLSAFIACLGLLGMASFIVEKRTKEIGIRKVLGATIASIIRLLSKEFFLLVACANILAWPVAYSFMHNWLQEYPYRVDFNILTLLMAAVFSLAVAILTISLQAAKAALANPVETLRTE